MTTFRFLFVYSITVFIAAPLEAAESSGYLVCVSNERDGTVTVIDGPTQSKLASIPVGKRPRGIHAAPDGRTLFVAVSGTPISGPPALDKNGNPILKKGSEDD